MCFVAIDHLRFVNLVVATASGEGSCGMDSVDHESLLRNAENDAEVATGGKF